MAVNSWSSIQNINNGRFWIWKKTHLLFNLISHQPDTDKIYLYARDLYETKYQFLINKREGVALKYFNNFKVFIEYLNDMDDIYKNIEDIIKQKCRVFDGMIGDMLNNKKPNPIVTELFIRDRK